MIAGAESGLPRDSRPRQRSRDIGLAVAAISAVAAVFLFLYFARSHNPQPYSGDEPHYLFAANSLITDSDFDLKNDYLLQRYHRYWPFYPIDPHVNFSIFGPDSPHWYPMHGIGLSILIAPAVVLGDAHGATIEMVGLCTLLLLLTFLWARRFTTDSWSAAIATAALGISPFYLGLEGRIFVDLVIAAVLLGALLIMEERARRPPQLVLLGVLVGIAPWLHFKNMLAFGSIAAIVVAQIVRQTSGRQRVLHLVLLTLPVAVFWIGFEIVVHAWYESWSPTQMQQSGNQVFAISEERGLAAGSFDSARGLLSNNPALLLILAGLPVWWTRWRAECQRVALAIAPAILIHATFNNWHAGFAPPGRYALEYVPALIPAIALFLHEARRLLLLLAAVLFGVQFALAGAFVWLKPEWTVEGKPSPFLTALDDKLGFAPDRAMPTFDATAGLARGGPQLAVWVSTSVLLVGCGLLVARRRRWRHEADAVSALKVPIES